MKMPPTLLLDFDGTLAPFNQRAGTEAVTALLVRLFGNKCVKFGAEFGGLYDAFSLLHYGSEEPGLVALKNRLNSYEVQLPPEFNGCSENFMWSRELWLKHVSEVHKLNLGWERIISMADAYWEAISLHSQIYPDAKEYLETLAKEGLPLFLVTASDCRLTLVNNSIAYDPKVSEEKKVRRVMEQGLSGFFRPQQAITGDPFNKPSPEFWQKCVKIAGLSDPSDAIVVDDSMEVVASAVKFGFKGCVLDRAGHYSRGKVEKSGSSYITEISQLKT